MADSTQHLIKEWTVLFTDCFEKWYLKQDESTRKVIFTHLEQLQFYGHNLGRPYADTVYGSKFTNMKELRIQYKSKPIRAFFAFDPKRQAIILCAGEKGRDKKFYQKMIKLADREFSTYLENMEA